MSPDDGEGGFPETENVHDGSGRYGDYTMHSGGNDLIDFPVSPLFLDHYHAQGMTPHWSGQQYRETPERPREPERRREALHDSDGIDRLWDAIRAQRQEINDLKARLRAPAPLRPMPAQQPPTENKPLGMELPPA